MSRRRQGRARSNSQTGQSTVEFALVFPMVVLAAFSVVTVLSVCTSVLGLNDSARILARAASTADDPVAAASQLASAMGIRVSTSVDPDTGIITVNASRTVAIWFLGHHLSPLVIHSSSAILREPQVVLGQ